MELSVLESEMLIDIYDDDMMPEMPFEIENYRLTEEEPTKAETRICFPFNEIKNVRPYKI